MINLTPLLRLYAKRRASELQKLSTRERATDCQRQLLLSLVGKAAQTDFGKKHDFSSIRSIEDFQARVPLRSYEQFWDEYWKQPFPYLNNVTWPGLISNFAVSSGTSSGTTKYIPYTKGTKQGYTQAGLDMMIHHVLNRPQSRLFSGKNFVLGGSTSLVEQAPGIFSGDISGISVKSLPWWAKLRYFPPLELTLLSDWEEKIEKYAQLSIHEHITGLSGVPSWMLILIERLFELKNAPSKRLVEVFPDLELIVHGGVNFAPYIDQFTQLMEGGHAELREVYPASEGFFAVADRSYGQGMRLQIDGNVFFEFVPLEELDSDNPRRHTLANVERDINYAVVLTTSAGLWSYIIGDTISFVDLEPARILVTGRTSYYLSAFGEHLIADEVEDAVSTAARSLNLSVRDFSVGARFPDESRTLGGHIFVVEFYNANPSPEQLAQFGTAIEKRLCERNEDYEAHLANGYGLERPEVRVVADGTFAEWMKSRGKLGGQNKVPRIITKQELFDSLLSYT
ncbi:MAG: GH3 auxin-responsive promoter family protein [Bdellovibrionales bacterium]|nr:GH3 auxin-responsive promoter family protein [Bdellovibrionales bacterium]